MPVRLGGKAIRGAKDAEGNQRHLLAALAGQSPVVAAKAEVGAKTNEVPMATQVLAQIDLNGKIVTADALHTMQARRWLTRPASHRDSGKKNCSRCTAGRCAPVVSRAGGVVVTTSTTVGISCAKKFVMQSYWGDHLRCCPRVRVGSPREQR